MNCGQLGVVSKLMLRTAVDLSERIDQIYRKAVDSFTSNVDDSSFVHSPDIQNFLVAARKLRYFYPLLLNEKNRNAFFLTLTAVSRSMPLTSSLN